VFLILVLEVATVVGYYFTAFFTYFIYSSLMGFVCMGVACLAAILFPWRRKDIFDSSPNVVKKRVGGVPLITIVGIVGFFLSVFLSYACVSPAVTPPPSGPPILQFFSYAIDLVIILSGLGIYVVAHYYRKSQGIPLETVFGVIPPL
jgi:FtsH-binding integral membrane protein